jgi:hypothetical protein
MKIKKVRVIRFYQPYQWADLDSSYIKYGNDNKYPVRQLTK